MKDLRFSIAVIAGLTGLGLLIGGLLQMTVGVPEYSLDSWGIKYVKKTKPTGATSSGLNTTDPHWRDQKVHRPEDRAGGDTKNRRVSAQIGENKIPDMHVSHGGARGTTTTGYSKLDSKQTDEYRAPIATGEREEGKRSDAKDSYKPAQGKHLAPSLKVPNRTTTAARRARQGGAHGTGTEKHPHTLPAEGGKGSKTSRQAVNQAMKSALNLAIIKCKLLLTKTYEQGGNVAQDKELSRTGDNPTGTKHVEPKIEGKHTEDTKYFSDAGALLGRGAAGKKLFDAQHVKPKNASDEDKSERDNEAAEQQAEEDEMESDAWHSQYD